LKYDQLKHNTYFKNQFSKIFILIWCIQVAKKHPVFYVIHVLWKHWYVCMFCCIKYIRSITLQWLDFKIQVQGPQLSQKSFDQNEIRTYTVTHLDIAKYQISSQYIVMAIELIFFVQILSCPDFFLTSLNMLTWYLVLGYI
jgi:hypothetical protein